MTTFDETTPLHSMPLKPGQYWSCEQPERRPISKVTIFDERCPKCVIGIQAAFANSIFGYVRVLDPETGAPTNDIRYTAGAVLDRLDSVNATERSSSSP